MKRGFKKQIWIRDRYICTYCNDKLTDQTASVDHKIPKYLLAVGQKQNMDNLVTACKPCNKEKADRNWQPNTSCIIIPAFKAKKYVTVK